MSGLSGKARGAVLWEPPLPHMWHMSLGQLLRLQITRGKEPMSRAKTALGLPGSWLGLAWETRVVGGGRGW